jgi:hypothetical protein
MPLLFLGYLIFIGYVHNLNIKKYTGKTILIGEPYNENYIKWYKWQKNIVDIDIIAIGSSRVLQFKSEFFSKPFFNLGYLVGTPKQTLQLIQEIKIKNKTIIISLDQWAFNAAWGCCESDFIKPIEPNFLRSSISPGRLKDILAFKVSPFINSADNNILKIGAGANISLDGITADGSYYYGKKYHGLLTNNRQLIGEDYQFFNTIDRIKKGDRRFQYGTESYQTALDEFEDLVKYNIEKGNNVVYFFPPFAPTIQNLLKTNNYIYISDASVKIKRISDKYKVDFFDFTFLESKDEMYIDGFHGGSELYYNLLKLMGLSIKNCNFQNRYETSTDRDLSLEREKIFDK